MEHHLHGYMNFCATERSYEYMQDVWESSKIEFVPVFNTTPKARICMNFQTVFADTQLVVSCTKCIRSWVRCTALQKKNLIRKSALY